MRGCAVAPDSSAGPSVSDRPSSRKPENGASDPGRDQKLWRSIGVSRRVDGWDTENEEHEGERCDPREEVPQEGFHARSASVMGPETFQRGPALSILLGNSPLMKP